MSLSDVIVEAAKDRIRDKKYRPAELAQRLPSIRRQYMSRFMQGRETVSIERATSIMEAAGLEIDVKSIRFKVKDSQAPRVLTGTPREDWG